MTHGKRINLGVQIFVFPHHVMSQTPLSCVAGAVAAVFEVLSFLIRFPSHSTLRTFA